MSRREERDDDLEAVEPGRGATLGKYQLLAVLGRGGMADVFLALSRGPMGFNKLVVVKRLRSALSDDRSFRNMFLDEARIAARLNHPNVVHTHEVGEVDGNYFIAMEYLEGQSLNKIIRRLSKSGEFLPASVCARIVSDALAGLQYAHELKDFDGTPLHIVHRDVSPHNVFVTYEGSVKMVDFGIAKAALSSVQTEVGVLKGKVAYMSPEQAAGGDIDARADVFAMGIVLWELVAQKRLMTGDSAAATLHRLLTSPIPKVTSERPDVPRELEAIIEKALEKEAKRRFPSALAMRDALESFIVHEGVTVRQEEIGRELGGMFEGVREAVQKQVQIHMEGITEIPLHDDEREEDDRSRRGASSRLPMLGVSGGSGSGVVSAFSTPAQDSSTPAAPRAPAEAAAGKRGVALWLLMAALVGGVAVIAFSMGRGNRAAAPAEDSIDFAAAASSPASASPTSQPAAAAAAARPSVAEPSTVGADVAVAAAVDTASPPARRPTGSRQIPSPTPRHSTSSNPSGAAAGPAAVTPSDEASGEGFLNLDTYPWTQVSENGKSLGTTPLVRVALSPGTHTLTLENPEQGLKQSYAVTIKGGETINRRLGLK
jgi:serine/threonine protein kinase